MIQTAEKEKILNHFSETFKERANPFSKNKKSNTSSVSLTKKTYSFYNAISGDYKNIFIEKKRIQPKSKISSYIKKKIHNLEFLKIIKIKKLVKKFFLDMFQKQDYMVYKNLESFRVKYVSNYKKTNKKYRYMNNTIKDIIHIEKDAIKDRLNMMKFKLLFKGVSKITDGLIKDMGANLKKIDKFGELVFKGGTIFTLLSTLKLGLDIVNVDKNSLDTFNETEDNKALISYLRSKDGGSVPSYPTAEPSNPEQTGTGKPEQTGTGKQVKQIDLFKALKNRGFTQEEAFVIMSNIWGESSYNLNTVSHLGAYGLMQWYGTRKDSLFALARSMKKSPDDLDVQIEMIWKELKESGSEAERFSKIMQNPSEIERVRDFALKIERPWTEAQLSTSVSAQKNMESRINKMKQFMRVIEDVKRKIKAGENPIKTSNNKTSSLSSIDTSNKTTVYQPVVTQNQSVKRKIINNYTYKIIEPPLLPFNRSSEFNEFQLMIS